MSEGKSHIYKGCGLFGGMLFLFGVPILILLSIMGVDVGVNNVPVVGDIIAGRRDLDYNFEIEPGEDDIITDEQEQLAYEAIEVGSTQVAKAVSLKIDPVQIEGPIVYGQDGEEMMRQGFWHFPGTVLPGEQGASVIFGHRRYHVPPARDTFYNLDQVRVGDIIEVTLENGKVLKYQVVSTTVVEPDDFGILQSGYDYHLKLVTCTPLGSWTHRLVVTGELIN